MAIFAGSLEDLNDIVDINRLESRLTEQTVDLSEILSDVSRVLLGGQTHQRIHISVPPIPLWMRLDAKRVERLLIQVLLKVLGTVSDTGSVTITVSQQTQGSIRGVEILIQDSERLKSNRPGAVGPEQDILKHWISENGLSMVLAHKAMKAHGGSIMAAGVAGTSLTIVLRFPQERMVSVGLITPPTSEAPLVQGLVHSNSTSDKKRKGTG
jgi:signal transduction histidine kinase